MSTRRLDELHECAECGLHYPEIAAAKKCEGWCKKYKSCNIQITNDSVEQKIIEKKRGEQL